MAPLLRMNHASLFLIFLSICSSDSLKSTCSSPGHPVILIPGDGGAQIYAKLNKTSVVHYVCEKVTSGYFDLWLNLELLVPLVIDCFVDNMKLVYNASTHRTENSPGVETRIPGWGNTSTVEWLDPSQSRLGHYYATLVQNAITWGYRRGKDIRGAPFDFRKAPNEAAEYFKKLRKLIEETYYANGNCRVVTIGHSMGNPYMLYFFNRQTQAWKDKFIRSHISISGPWGGSMKILLLLASGTPNLCHIRRFLVGGGDGVAPWPPVSNTFAIDLSSSPRANCLMRKTNLSIVKGRRPLVSGYNLDHWKILLNPLSLRPEQRSMTSTTFLMPSDKFWSPNETLIATPTRNYTAGDYKQFFDDIHFPDGWLMFQDTGNLIKDLVPPGVEIHCLYGVKVKTPDAFEYGKGQFPDTQPQTVYGDGDGTVNLRSLEGCLRWRTRQKQGVFSRAFPNQEHLDILKSSDLVSYVKKVLMGP